MALPLHFFHAVFSLFTKVSVSSNDMGEILAMKRPVEVGKSLPTQTVLEENEMLF